MIPWSSLMWPKDYLNMCHIFYWSIFLLIFIRVLGYATDIKSSKPRFLRWHHLSMEPSSNIIISKVKVHVGQSVLSARFTMAWYTYTCKRKVVKMYLWNAIVTKHLALTIWHSNIYWNDNVYWMLIWPTDVTSRIFVWKIFCGRIQVLWRKLTEFVK